MNETRDYRYPGSHPFQDTELDRLRFFGRDREERALLHLILSERLVVLFSKSGVGKTSLLNTNVFDALRQRHYFPISVRLNDPDADPLDLVYEHIDKAAKKRKVDVTAREDPRPALWHYFKTTKFWSDEKIRFVVPVLVFDQFEEFFAFYKAEPRRTFIEQVGDLVRGVVPRALQHASEDQGPRFYSEAPPEVKIVLAIREDRLAHLQEMATEVPSILHNRYWLTAMTPDQAEAAIAEPAQLDDEQLTQRFTYNAGAIKAMIDFLRTKREGDKEIISDEIEPFQLQLLCQYVERRIIKEKQGADAEAMIIVNETDLGGKVGMQKILANFYDDQVEKLASPEEKKVVRKLCEQGLIFRATGGRVSLAKEMIAHNYGVSEVLLSTLVDYRLLRAEPRVGSVYYELSHDTLVEPILQSRQRRLREEQRQLREKQRRRRRKMTVGGSLLGLPLLLFALYSVLTQKVVPPPRDVVELCNSAERAGDIGNYDEAVQLYRSCMERDSSYVKAYLGLGDLLDRRDRIDTALVVYQKALDNEINDATIHYRMGKLYGRQGNSRGAKESFEAAVKSYEKEIKDNKQNVNAYENLALTHIELRAYDEAVEVYRRAVEVNPVFATMYRVLVTSLGEKERDQPNLIVGLAEADSIGRQRTRRSCP